MDDMRRLNVHELVDMIEGDPLDEYTRSAAYAELELRCAPPPAVVAAAKAVLSEPGIDYSEHPRLCAEWILYRQPHGVK